MIRVGTIKNGTDKLAYPAFESIMVMTKSSKYGSLGPYCLKNKAGHNMENIWQFSKVYASVPASKQYCSRWDRTVIWDHPAETHVDANGKTNTKYANWKKMGTEASYPIRYPVGMKHRSQCLYSLDEDGRKLDYIEARKSIYYKVYSNLVRQESQYKLLLSKLKKGKNLLILEVDGPKQQDLAYYQTKYAVAQDFIEGSTMLCDPVNLQIMLNDARNAFGHGYCLAWCLYEDLHGTII
jgi:hypothetical protein